MITHNPFAVIVLITPAMTALAKLLELGKPFRLIIFKGAEWINYSWAKTYLSALAGGFLHLGWDLTMHEDINLGFPFISLPNPFVNYTVLAIIGMASVALLLPSYFVGKKINRGSLLRNCREITTTKNTFTLRFLGGCPWGDAKSAAISHL